MRKLLLSDDDMELFSEELTPESFCVIKNHIKTLNRIHDEQGKKFWTRYIVTFRSFVSKVHGLPKKFEKFKPIWEMYDETFIVIHKNFSEGNFKVAKVFLKHIKTIAAHVKLIEAPRTNTNKKSSIASNPFYHVNSREAFRAVFGEPDQNLNMSKKVIIQTPVLIRFAASLDLLIRRWLKLKDNDVETDDYWTVPSEFLQENFKPFLFEYYLASYWKEELQSIFNMNSNLWLSRVFKSQYKYPPSDNSLKEFWTVSSDDESSVKKKRKKKRLNEHECALEETTDTLDKQDFWTTMSKVNPFQQVFKETNDISKELMEDLKNTESKKLSSAEISEDYNNIDSSKHDIKELCTKMISLNGAVGNSRSKVCEESKTPYAQESSGGAKSYVSDEEEENVCRSASAEIDKAEEHGNLKGFDMDYLKKLETIHSILTAPNITQRSSNKKMGHNVTTKFSHLKICAYCDRQEAVPKTFKKCQRCKEENFAEPCYYCGKECQMEDWLEYHREEHIRLNSK